MNDRLEKLLKMEAKEDARIEFEVKLEAARDKAKVEEKAVYDRVEEARTKEETRAKAESNAIQEETEKRHR